MKISVKMPIEVNSFEPFFYDILRIDKGFYVSFYYPSFCFVAGKLAAIRQSREVVSRVAHNHEIAGSSPVSAPIPNRRTYPAGGKTPVYGVASPNEVTPT